MPVEAALKSRTGDRGGEHEVRRRAREPAGTSRDVGVHEPERLRGARRIECCHPDTRRLGVGRREGRRRARSGARGRAAEQGAGADPLGRSAVAREPRERPSGRRARPRTGVGDRRRARPAPWRRGGLKADGGRRWPKRHGERRPPAAGQVCRITGVARRDHLGATGYGDIGDRADAAAGVALGAREHELPPSVTTPIGSVAVPVPVSVTVTVHCVGVPASTVPGAQATVVLVGRRGGASKAPMSHAAPCGRLTPRWSVAGGGIRRSRHRSLGSAPSACVCVGPPLFASGPSSALRPLLSPGAVSPQLESLRGWSRRRRCLRRWPSSSPAGRHRRSCRSASTWRGSPRHHEDRL